MFLSIQIQVKFLSQYYLIQVFSYDDVCGPYFFILHFETIPNETYEI